MSDFIPTIVVLFLFLILPIVFFIKNKRWVKKLSSLECPECKNIYGREVTGTMIEGNVSWHGKQLDNGTFNMNKGGSYSIQTIICPSCSSKTTFNEDCEIIERNEREQETSSN